MLKSPLAFYRGAAVVMAADLATTPTTGIKVRVCGDCHLMNFGGFGTPERHVVFDLNDFDETLPGPWEWDVKRLATSFVLAARAAGLTDQRAREVAVISVRSYRVHLRKFSNIDPLRTWSAHFTMEHFVEALPSEARTLVRARLDKARRRGESELGLPKLTKFVDGRLGIRDAPPLIFHPKAAREPGLLQFGPAGSASIWNTRPEKLPGARSSRSLRTISGYLAQGKEWNSQRRLRPTNLRADNDCPSSHRTTAQYAPLLWLSLQPDPFGTVSVVKEWGRIGQPGSHRHEVCVDVIAARAALTLRMSRKIKRGYRRVGFQGDAEDLRRPA
jgi:hypothetical protein